MIVNAKSIELPSLEAPLVALAVVVALAVLLVSEIAPAPDTFPDVAVDSPEVLLPVMIVEPVVAAADADVDREEDTVPVVVAMIEELELGGREEVIEVLLSARIVVLIVEPPERVIWPEVSTAEPCLIEIS